MANTTNNSQMLQHLRAIFPQLPDDVIWRVITQYPNDYQACSNALQKLRYPVGYGMRTSSVDLRDRPNLTPSGQAPPPHHRYSEPSVHYQRNISEYSIHLEPQKTPGSAPPGKSTFTVQYSPPPPYVPYSTAYNTQRSAPPPVRSYSTTASLVMNHPDRRSPVPWSDPPPSYAPNDSHQYNVGTMGQPRENTVISTMQYRPNNFPVTPVSTRSSTVFQHANSSPMLDRRPYQGRQLKEILMSTPNEQALGTPAPIKPLISPASSVSSLTDSPEVKPETKQPPLIITKEQEEYAYTQALLLHQRMRFQRLNKDYEEEKQILENLKEEVESMEKQLAEKRAIKSTQCTAKTITKLSEQNRQLAIDIECMNREIELHKMNQDKYQEGFYENIGYTGAPGPVPHGHPDPRAIVPQYKVPSVHEGEDGFLLVMDADDDQQWSCRFCTFLNHPCLSKCETCESPRM